MIFGNEHWALMHSVKQLCEREVDPHFTEWEVSRRMPAPDLFKKLGDAGFLGINKSEAYGGQGLDYSYQMAFAKC